MSWRRPEAETKTRSSRRRRHERLGAPGRCATAAPELQEHYAQDNVAGGGRRRPDLKRRRPDLKRRRRSNRGEEKGIVGERERKRESERVHGRDKDRAILLEQTRKQEVARARLRGTREEAPASSASAPLGSDGADRSDPPVSGSAEAVRSDSTREWIGRSRDALSGAVGRGRGRRVESNG